MDIIASCKAAVKGRGLRVVLPEGEDERILRAAAEIAREDIAHPIVLANDSHAVRERLMPLGAGGGAVRVLSPESDPAGAELAAYVAANRERMNERTAGRLVKKPLYFGGALVAGGQAEALSQGSPTRRVA